MPPRSPGSTPAGPRSVLGQIYARRREQVAAAQRRVPLAALKERALDNEGERRDFLAPLRFGPRPAVIAELKWRSPSAGRLRETFEVGALAASYQWAGAAALSVLTEPDDFEGRLEYLEQAREATRLPILRKDFLFCDYQIWESAAAGADAVLLIAAMLDQARLQQLLATCERAGVAALCEVHDAGEMQRVIAAGADCIGVNNRNLHTLKVDFETGLALAGELPPAAVGVAESGLRQAGDLARFSAAGYHAFLIGEQFMRAPDPGAALAGLLNACRRPLVKVCGITRLEDAEQATRAGADAIGFVFAPSPRRISRERARDISPMLPAQTLRVGVFAGASTTEIRNLVQLCGLHAVQLHGPSYMPLDAQRLAPHVAVWRAVGMPRDARAALQFAPYVERFVLDSAHAELAGGSGRSFHWEAAREFAAALAAAGGAQPELIVAGGLNATNVAEALRRSGAAGADAASGVESAPGVKDPAAVAAFILAAHAVFRAEPEAEAPARAGGAR
ncbi:MAG: hypothetical protein ACRD01_05700 [Terriglobales bacterium]